MIVRTHAKNIFHLVRAPDVNDDDDEPFGYTLATCTYTREWMVTIATTHARQYCTTTTTLILK